ncbi:hypothetical protein LguiA_021863 [Lonicera macranthoides]
MKVRRKWTISITITSQTANYGCNLQSKMESRGVEGKVVVHSISIEENYLRSIGKIRCNLQTTPWTPKLQQRFVQDINQLGFKRKRMVMELNTPWC